ncbi:MAG: helix-turn-helix domain-containing protein [Pseudomonadota bacterium]|nr:helix-turn-helix domain-containing protein [Pseudomonadota bacterium]
MDNKNAVTALAALAQDSRLSVFRRLVELGPEGAFAGELADFLDIPANTLSFHLKALAHAGLVGAEPSGRHIRYRADFCRMQDLLGFLSDNCWRRKHCRASPRISTR